MSGSQVSDFAAQCMWLGRRAITTTVRKELAAGAPHYLELCRILGYDPHNWDCRDGNKVRGRKVVEEGIVELGL